MLVGHFAVGLVAKRCEPKVSLGTFVLAALLADLLWCLFLIVGLEHVRFKAGNGVASYMTAENIELSHSLAMDGLWAASFAGIYFLRRRSAVGAGILFFVVLSHWLLDFLSHGPDMPLIPGFQKYLGLNLWASIPASLVVEGGIWIVAVILFARVTRPRNSLGVYLYWVVVVVLTLTWYNNLAGPPPRSPQAAPFASLVFFSLAVAWAYWMNSLRPPKYLVDKTSGDGR
ncbi:MAG TPA: hypothetical protein VHZ55_28445 [Bryobacteraceae bacterium]|jgi:hypothetical protein|nr:hypothetical protein [Bryobacteraceae bacterium]